MARTFVVALDQGTTSSRAVLFDMSGRAVGMARRELKQSYPRSGWVEHDPQEIWTSQQAMLDEVVRAHGVAPGEIAAIGIANQRETTIVWERATGRPVAPAIVWQDRRTAPLCEALRAAGLEPAVRQRTGLVLDPYFSGTKIRWILDHVPGARERARRGELLAGTVDCWLLWNLTQGAVHATDPSNASRTMLYDIHRQQWDAELLNALEIPAAMLPEVRDSAGSFGAYRYQGVDLPVCGVAGDQQAALFGQACLEEGMAKNTYGTGCFLLMNIGERPCFSRNGLLTTIAWRMGGRVHYALEGSVLVAGAALQWLRDGLGIIRSAAESEALAREAGEAEDVMVVPAFAGLGAPHWDMYARGAILGVTQHTTRAQIVKATLESLAFQTQDVLAAMEADTQLHLRELRVDGGAAANDFLLQVQADLLNVPVVRAAELEATARGAACLAGVAAGVWDARELAQRWAPARAFTPQRDDTWRRRRGAQWQAAVQRSRGWAHPE